MNSLDILNSFMFLRNGWISIPKPCDIRNDYIFDGIIYFRSRLKLNFGLFWFSFFFLFVYFAFYCNLPHFPLLWILLTPFAEQQPQISGFLPSKFLYALWIYSFSLFVPELIESQYLVVCTSLMNCNDKTGAWESKLLVKPINYFLHFSTVAYLLWFFIDQTIQGLPTYCIFSDLDTTSNYTQLI